MFGTGTTTDVEVPLARFLRVEASDCSGREAAPRVAAAFDHSTLKSRYERLFGPGVSHLDPSVLGRLDERAMAEALGHAERLAAAAFGATRSFFVTCGTTVANHVAFEGAVGRGQRVLLDRTAHQSLHCAAMRRSCQLTYTPVLVDTEYPGSVIPDVQGMLDLLEVAGTRGRHPFDVVVLCASSYDGITYDLSRVLDACLERCPNLTFVIDEAWAAVNNFHSDLRRWTALAAAEFLAARRGTVPPMVVTHSAHKSMAAARQGSYLHVVGGERLIHRVEAALLAHRPSTTNIPILASLDLARAHAVADGNRLVSQALWQAEQFRVAVRGDPSLRPFGILELGSRRPELFGYLTTDPLRIMVDTSLLGLGSDRLKSLLFRDYNIYVSRTVDPGFLVTFRIGITSADRERLCRALASIGRRAELLASHGSRGQPDSAERPSSSLLIAYPPGVPIAVPGEPNSPRVRRHLEFYRHSGADIYTIAAQR